MAVQGVDVYGGSGLAGGLLLALAPAMARLRAFGDDVVRAIWTFPSQEHLMRNVSFSPPCKIKCRVGKSTVRGSDHYFCSREGLGLEGVRKHAGFSKREDLPSHHDA